ncbi:Galactose/methyl galactoside ABC transport system, ATP-binding protein MglA [Olavius algarvensis spirochete endosymbiont]|uniref:sugar ABC transporter ATP-binding protein n=1 Tax=Olavius algarvensis spirochete endosymbiont TaxID=260710 RepID=UPI00052D6585|nr:ATP-binding cassette domain-containing protein [Olavius algarvensis spirochete endosymbiont]KGM42924.1 sugar ABC transporter ATP-binding protein [Alkalispirochaeta odontotermitis]CAD7846092.1 MAG: Galactose/methyl galactoside ABC transporter, ATP-binding protein MglA (EC 3.6.3.17) [Olavius algarvensis spirochete endosymbiont]VDA99236.1 Galactose/methyl galactoside ABC transport system, ATP-binding protein MglA [Olavius algarvensis spirochete endosymbiont]
MHDYLLGIESLSKSFSGIKVLDNVHLQVRSGTVHSLMGENGAGKSTMMKCLFGIYRQDSGRFFLEGEEFNFIDPKHALENGVSMVHQELNQVTQRTISDNIWLGRYPRKGFFVDEKAMYRASRELFARLGIHLDPNLKLDALSVSQRQMVEIAKAVSYEAKIIVLDEPTSSLTDNEVRMLFDIIRVLRSHGVGIIYISHKMDEIFEVSDEVTVLRDGQYIGTEAIENLDMERIVNMMVGRDLGHRFPPRTNVPGEIHMKVSKITTKYSPIIRDVSFELRRGEILGISGLVGAGRTELVESLFGARTLESGEIYIDGRKINNSTAQKSIGNRFALLTEERRSTGLYPVADITFNSTIANVKSYRGAIGLLDDKSMTRDTETQIDNMRIKTPSYKEQIRDLSGGNQQKVIIGRWLLTDPDILLLDEPTRGIDVGAKFEIYQLIINLAREGKSVIMVSSEMPELIGITNRIMVMSNGRMAGIVETEKTNQTEIFNLAMKYLINSTEAEI